MATPSIRVGANTYPLRCASYLVDANLLIEARVATAPRHRTASLLLVELLRLRKQGAVQLWVSPLVVSEVWGALLRIHYDVDHGKGAWRKLTEELRSASISARQAAKQQRAVAARAYHRQLSEVTDFVLASDRFDIASLDTADIRCGLGHMHRHGMLPQDSLHCAVMERCGIDGLISNDGDFESVPLVAQRIPY
jgi:predicted nucleic acid-binding protein